MLSSQAQAQQQSQAQAQPIKAKVRGKGGRKHTLAPLSLDPLTGQVLIRFDCIKPGCGCSGVYRADELLGAVEEFKRENQREEEGRENGNQQRQEAA